MTVADRDEEGYMTTPWEIPLPCADLLSIVVWLFTVEYKLLNIEYYCCINILNVWGASTTIALVIICNFLLNSWDCLNLRQLVICTACS